MPESIPEPFAEIARGCLRCDPAQRFSLGDVKVRLGFPDADSPGRPNPPTAVLASAWSLWRLLRHWPRLPSSQLFSFAHTWLPRLRRQLKTSQPTTSFLHRPGPRPQTLEKQKPLRKHALKTHPRCRWAQRKSPPPEPLWPHLNLSGRKPRSLRLKPRLRRRNLKPAPRKGRCPSARFARPASQRYSKHSGPRRRQDSRRRRFKRRGLWRNLRLARNQPLLRESHPPGRPAMEVQARAPRRSSRPERVDSCL